MAYILNNNIPANKLLPNALTSIYGIGTKRALKITHDLCLSPRKRASLISPTHQAKITSRLREGCVASKLRKKRQENIQYLIKIRCYRGIRHKTFMPVRGQRTHTNAKTAKRCKKTKKNS